MLSLLVALEVAADELGETSRLAVAQDAAASEFEAKEAAAIHQSQTFGWQGPGGDGENMGGGSSNVRMCMSQLGEFCASDPAPAFCASSRTCGDTIRVDYKNYYNTTAPRLLAFDFPVCEGGWPCWDPSYSAGECWRRGDDSDVRVCAWKGVSCSWSLCPDAGGPCRISQDPTDFGPGDGWAHQTIYLDISGFPPANESDVYSVPADLSECSGVLEQDGMCATLFESNQAPPRVAVCALTQAHLALSSGCCPSICRATSSMLSRVEKLFAPLAGWPRETCAQNVLPMETPQTFKGSRCFWDCRWRSTCSTPSRASHGVRAAATVSRLSCTPARLPLGHPRLGGTAWPRTWTLPRQKLGQITPAQSCCQATTC